MKHLAFLRRPEYLIAIALALAFQVAVNIWGWPLFAN